ncbi:helix-turn-helix transcriptional regulator [Myroides albus]|uniref:AraC family transcriptional regulator n=1 Tax=Myroides albus TaxID=2562892 RepID=UPI00215951FE|nr:AraC family transcriptional regulator [Myroides albus]UVD80733.1 helix-turn-helix transcriptional regulator [Myroides albus]
MLNQSIRSCSISYFTHGNSSLFMGDTDSIVYDFPLLSQCFVGQFYMIIIVTKGKYAVTVNEYNLTDQDQTVIIIKPGDYAQLHFEDCSGYVIAFEESFFSQRYHENNLRLFNFFQPEVLPYAKLPYDQLSKLLLMVQLMVGEYQSVNQNREVVLRSYLNILLFDFQNLTEHPVPMSESLVKPLNDKVGEFVALVDQFYKEAKTPSFYADKLCVTPNYLNKLCKQERGLTAGQIVRQRIIVEAKRLLRFTSFTIKEIGNELQFNSTSYFVTFFKKQEGKTPEEYRRLVV